MAPSRAQTGPRWPAQPARPLPFGHNLDRSRRTPPATGASKSISRHRSGKIAPLAAPPPPLPAPRGQGAPRGPPRATPKWDSRGRRKCLPRPALTLRESASDPCGQKSDKSPLQELAWAGIHLVRLSPHCWRRAGRRRLDLPPAAVGATIPAGTRAMVRAGARAAAVPLQSSATCPRQQLGVH